MRNNLLLWSILFFGLSACEIIQIATEDFHRTDAIMVSNVSDHTLEIYARTTVEGDTVVSQAVLEPWDQLIFYETDIVNPGYNYEFPYLDQIDSLVITRLGNPIPHALNEPENWTIYNNDPLPFSPEVIWFHAMIIENEDL